MPLTSIMQILCTINYILNDEKLSLKDIIIYEEKQQEYEKIIENERINNNLINLQEETIHNTINLENIILTMVKNGDTNGLKNWINKAPAIRGGILANEQIRQLKNTFIVTITLVARAAIKGGLNVEESLALSDSYIQKCEVLNSIENITNLQYHMLMDYTARVEKLKFSNVSV